MIEIKPLYPPMVYRVKRDPLTKLYYLEAYVTHFQEPSKYYGNTLKYVNHFWNSFKNSTTNMGVMLIGTAGSGKTLLAEKLANTGIANGMITVLVSNIKVDIELIEFLDNLNSSIIILDEFSKNFYYELQNKMLTMFSNSTAEKKLFIIAENTKDSISSLIKNRPGRVRYRLNFGKVDKDVLAEYCMDMGVDKSFLRDLVEVYDSARVMSFDHMQCIVDEHIAHPDYSINELFEILNLDILGGTKVVKLVKAFDTKENKELEFEKLDIPYEQWSSTNDDVRFYIYVKLKPSIVLTNKDIVHSDDKHVVAVVGDVRLEFDIIET